MVNGRYERPHGAPSGDTRRQLRRPRVRRILLAEDDLEMRRLIADTLRRAGYEVIEARNGGELLDQLTGWLVDDQRPVPFDLVISDQRMPGFTGLGVLEGLRAFAGAPPFILITAFGGSEFAAEACRAGARAVLDKPFELPDLLATVARLIGPFSD
jgi:CheY-like chemotaxis protein